MQSSQQGHSFGEFLHTWNRTPPPVDQMRSNFKKSAVCQAQKDELKETGGDLLTIADARFIILINVMYVDAHDNHATAIS